MLWLFAISGIVGIFYILNLLGRSIERARLSSSFARHAFEQTVEKIPNRMNELIRIIGHDAATEEEKIEARQELHRRFIQFVFDLGAMAAFLPDLQRPASWDIIRTAIPQEQSEDYEALMNSISIIVENINTTVDRIHPPTQEDEI